MHEAKKTSGKTGNYFELDGNESTAPSSLGDAAKAVFRGNGDQHVLVEGPVSTQGAEAGEQPPNQRPRPLVTKGPVCGGAQGMVTPQSKPQGLCAHPSGHVSFVESLVSCPSPGKSLCLACSPATRVYHPVQPPDVCALEAFC